MAAEKWRAGREWERVRLVLGMPGRTIGKIGHASLYCGGEEEGAQDEGQKEKQQDREEVYGRTKAE